MDVESEPKMSGSKSPFAALGRCPYGFLGLSLNERTIIQR